MRSCGVIVEYNPFHKGHAHHLKEAKEKSGADCCIAVMSGNFVQRGEPAILDKWTRTKLALEAGADLIVELPWFGAVQPADYFGAMAIQLLSALQVDAFCFGTEREEGFSYMDFVKKEKAHQKEVDQWVQHLNSTHPEWPYPKKIAEAYREVFPKEYSFMDQSNHLLGLAYARANLQLEKPLELLTIERKGSQHRDQKLASFASGTAIRKAVQQRQWNHLKEYVPTVTYQALKKGPCHDWEDYWPQLQGIGLSLSSLQWSQLYEVHDGLEERLQKAFYEANSFSEWKESLDCAHLTQAKIQRLATYILTQTTKKEVAYAWKHPYIKILGFSLQGRQWLREKELSLPVVVNIRQQEERLLRLEQRYDMIYLSPYQTPKDYFSLYKPIIKEEL